MRRQWQLVFFLLSLVVVAHVTVGCGTTSGTTAKPDFSLTATGTSIIVTAGGSAQTVSVSAAALNGFSGTIQVTASGIPAGVTATPASFTLTPGTPQTVSFSATATATASTATVHFSGTAASLTHTAPVTLTVQAPVATPDFSLTATGTTVTVTAGGTAQTVSVSATALNGFSGAIQVTTSGLPTGVTATPATFALTPGTPQSVSFSATATAAATTATVQFSGTAANLTHTAPVTLTVKTAVTTTPNVDVTTYHFDVGRTGLNPNETTLTPSNVTSAKFGLLRVLTLDGKVDAQPLYLSNLTAGGQQRNVVYAVTEHDSVYAFDADSGAQIWKTSILGASETTRSLLKFTAAGRINRGSVFLPS
jgi:hypothetical protein